MKKMLGNIFIVLALCGLSHICTAQTSSDTSNQKIIFDDINAYRVKHGLSQLENSDAISTEAKRHSLDMANHTIPFGHDGFDQRMHKLFGQFKQSRGIAENVAYTSEEAESVVQQWLKSSGHRENIEGNYNMTGIGIAHDKNGLVYVTQIFLRN